MYFSPGFGPGKNFFVGKTITYSNGQEYVVKGVIGSPVNKTWLNFDLLLANTSSNRWRRCRWICTVLYLEQI